MLVSGVGIAQAVNARRLLRVHARHRIGQRVRRPTPILVAFLSRRAAIGVLSRRLIGQPLAGLRRGRILLGSRRGAHGKLLELSGQAPRDADNGATAVPASETGTAVAWGVRPSLQIPTDPYIV
ncbi:hypothetical protein HMPREF0004_4775 [Achromobacter piechaudii ATCC 43553]|uniref:Uncharacterized protein n=1 Tax=Achromobacter piechaudii ATCC 43553 TaxID=742159 RepID=D4XH28_9BURK|nr:hypothetical protein HMPREF0004_4775 [Achromobacter piechaudii ATCC 43553]